MLVLLRTFLVAGHAAILLVNDKEKGYYYNMAKDGKFTSKILSSEQVKNVLEEGEINPQKPQYDNSKKPYTRYVKMPITNEEARKMIREAETHKNDEYGFFTNNCTQVATQILNAGKNNYMNIMIPNIMYYYLKVKTEREKE